MKRIAIAIAAVVAMACGGNSPAPAPAADATAPPGQVVEVNFWHAFASGANGDATKFLVDKFNSQNQGKIHVTSTAAAANYDDALAKYKASIQSNSLPDLMQVYDIGTRFMIDSKTTTPIQTFIDKEHYNSTDLWPNILGYYSINNRLNSMPWNVSMPILYINKDAFSAAGLDPNKPPTSLDEIRTMSQKLTKRDANGNVTQYGFSAAIYGWFLEQWTARNDQQFCNNGNGRDKNATKMNFGQPTEVQVVDWWSKMVADGLALNTGRSTGDAQKAFIAGRAAIIVESTGALRGFTNQVKFQLGTGFWPKVDANTAAGGPIIGGASLWIGNSKPAYVQNAAWQFVKFLEQPDSMSYWHTHTGYFPTDKKALEQADDQAWVAQYPQFTTAITQLQQTKVDKATQGCLLGVMPQARQAAENAIEAALTKKSSPKQALDDATAAVQPAIDQYNQSVGAK